MRRRLLASLVAVAALLVGASSAEAARITVSGSYATQPLVQQIALAFTRATHQPVTVAGTGATEGANCPKSGSCTLGMISRDQQSSDPSTFTPFAHDAIVVTVNPYIFSHGVKNLSLAQVRGIFSGSIRNWKAVGGPNVTIDVYQRSATAGIEQEFKKLFLGSLTAPIFSGAPALATEGQMRSAVAAHKHAIGFSSQYFDATSTSVTGVSVEHVAPTLRNAKSNRYPYTHTFYFTTLGAPTGDAKKFIQFALAPAQRALVGRYWIPLH